MLNLLFTLVALLTPAHASQAIATQPLPAAVAIQRYEVPTEAPPMVVATPGISTVNEKNCPADQVEDVLVVTVPDGVPTAPVKDCLGGPDGDEVFACVTYPGDGTWIYTLPVADGVCADNADGSIVDPDVL